MWKGKYHINPSKGLLNDPNGLIYYKGEYHVFFQWNPNECSHGSKHWAHRKSKDLIEWEELPTALKPGDWYDMDGCYSGSAVEKDGILYLIYTGNVKKGQRRYSYQCLAKSLDGVSFEKLGPIIDDGDIPVGYTRHYRDPKVYFADGKYYMYIGAQKDTLKGTIVKYESLDLINWKFLGEILEGEFGYMCECPDVFNLEGEEVLIFSPQGIEPLGDLYNNLYQSGYILKGGEFIELDRGFDFYAPQTFLDEYGQRVLIAWMGMVEDKIVPSIEKENWVYSLTLPRILEIKNNKIYQRPHDKLKKLRKKRLNFKNLEVKGKLDLSKLGAEGESYELLIFFEEKVSDFRLDFRKAKRERTSIEFSSEEKKIILDRNHSGESYDGVRKCRIEKLEKLQLFVDRSSVEVFVNGGEEVFSAAVFPGKDSLGIEINSLEEFVITEIDFYKI